MPPLAASARFDDRLKPVEPPTSVARHVSGSEGRPMADSLRNLFPLHQKRPKGNPKTIGFWRRSFPHFFRCWKKWGRRRHRRRKHSAGSKKRVRTKSAAWGTFHRKRKKRRGTAPPLSPLRNPENHLKTGTHSAPFPRQKSCPRCRRSRGSPSRRSRSQRPCSDARRTPRPCRFLRSCGCACKIPRPSC